MSIVHFLPWKRIDEYKDWIAAIGIANHVRERDFVAMKIHFGEKGNQGYVKPAFVKPIVRDVTSRNAFPFLTDANTIYVGKRADAYHHMTVAASHGYSLEKMGCPIIIADGLRGNSGVDVEVNLKHFKTVSIANAVHYSDSMIFISHFKGHEISGFGGVLKNAGMGCGTRAGKYAMHDKLQPAIGVEKCIGCGQCEKWCSTEALKVVEKKITFKSEECVGCGECILSCVNNVFSIPWDEKASSVQEKIVEYAYGVMKNKPLFSMNVINYVTQYCDCYPTKAKPLMDNIGIMASADPVALDQASADIVNKTFGSDFFRHIFPDIDWTVQLAYAEQLGLGTREYTLQE